MKLRLLPLALVAAFAGQAHALDIATTNAASTIKVYAAGASAIRNIVGQLFIANCASNLDVYYSSNVAVNSVASQFASDGANGDSHRVYTCTLKAEGSLDSDLNGKGLGGKNIAFFKRDANGSALGVFPVALGTSAANLKIDSASCATTGSVAGATTPSYTCSTAENLRAPDLGFSDVEPSLFKGINVPSGFGFSTTGLTSAQNTALTIKPTFQTVMAVAVSGTLYTALQTAQSTSGTPSIPRTILGSLLRGELAAPADGFGWQSLGVANPTQQVNICRRSAGSGSQAAANILSSNFPCAANANTAPAVNGSSDDGQGGVYANNLTPASWTTGNFFVYEGGSTGNVGSCLSNANDAGGYAVGHISRDNAEPTNGKWKFIALDGVVPHRDTLKTGSYDYAVESTAQYRTSVITALNAGSADDKAKAGFITGFVNAVGRPVNMAALSSAAAAGLAALSSATNIYNDPANINNKNFVSRVSRTNSNNCTPFGVVQ